MLYIVKVSLLMKWRLVCGTLTNTPVTKTTQVFERVFLIKLMAFPLYHQKYPVILFQGYITHLFTDCWKEMKQVPFRASLVQNLAPLTVSRISSIGVMYSRGTGHFPYRGWRRPSDSCYQNSLPLTQTRETPKTQGERGADFPPLLSE